MYFWMPISKGTRQKKKKNVENSTLGLTHPPPVTENVENFQKKKKLKKL